MLDMKAFKSISKLIQMPQKKTLQYLIEIAKKHTPVANTISNATPVNITLSNE